MRWGTLPVVLVLAGASPRLARASEVPRPLEDTPFLLVGEGWSAALLEDLRAGLAALPPRVRRPPTPIELELHPEASSLGMGDGTVERPEWSRGQGRFHLYAYAEPLDDERAASRLERLEPAQRERLWRRRAAVHAVLQRWEAERGFARADDWRLLSGWPRRGALGPTIERAANTYAWAFSRRRGMASASLDFLTFAEEALVPVEALAPAAISDDDSVRCQERSKSRFLAAALASVDPSARPLARGRCDAFEAWARPEELEGFELWYSEPTGRHVESLFGHLMLHPVRRLDARWGDTTSARVWEVAAIVGAADGGLTFLSRGFLGGYATIFSSRSVANLVREAVERDQRSLRRFRLNLTASERDRLLERLWELQRRGYLRYRFLTDNCASLLLWLLAPALEVAHRPSLDVPFPFVAPTMVLERLESVAVPGPAGPRALLERLPVERASTHDEAEEAVARRDAALAVLVDLEPAVAGRWARWASGVRGPPALRREAWSGLVALARQDAEVRLRPASRAALIEVIEASLRVERHAAQEATNVALRVDARRVDRGQVPAASAEALVAKRQARFRRERVGLTDEESMEEYVHRRRVWEEAPRRPPSAVEATLLEEVAQAHEVLLHASEQAGAALDALGGPAGEGLLGQAPRPSGPALPGSGFFRLAVGPALTLAGRGDVGAGLRLRFAVVAEHVGDQRSAGLGPHTEVRLADARALLGLGALGPELSELTFDLVRLRGLGREPEPLRRPWGWLGWGFGLGFRHHRGSPVPDAAFLHAEASLPVGDARSGRLLAPALGVGAEVRPGASSGLLALGPRVELAGRLPLGAGGLRLEASWRPQLVALGRAGGRLEHAVSAELTAELVVGPVLVGPAVAVRALRGPLVEELSLVASLSLERL